MIVTIIYIIWKNYELKYFKSNPKIHHYNYKWYLAFLLKLIYQIQRFILYHFHPLYYHVITLGYVDVAVHCNHSVKYIVNRMEQHPSNHTILRWYCHWLLSLEKKNCYWIYCFIKHNNDNWYLLERNTVLQILFYRKEHQYSSMLEGYI